MIYLYRLLYFLTKLTLKITTRLWPQKIQEWVHLRNQPLPSIANFKGKSIWFHAASGEIEYVKPIIREIKSKNPSQFIVLTYTSPSLEKLLFNIRDQIDCLLPLPWDESEKIKSIFNFINPSQIVFAKTDLWPEILHCAKVFNVPCVLVSFSAKTQKMNLARRWCLSHLSKIYCIDEYSLENLKKNKFQNGVLAADTRYDQVFFRLSQPSKFNVHFIKPIFVFASTWPEDDFQLLPITQDILNLGFQIVWCSHDVGQERINSIGRQLKGFQFKIYHPSLTKCDQEILVINEVGLLPDIYRIAKMVFVGGSFRQKVHSVMEPLCGNSIVFFGPHFKNNSEALEFLSLGLCYSVSTGTELVESVKKLSQNQIEVNKSRPQIACGKHLGSSKKIADQLLE